jgi:deoxyribodipyrimidine photo-lyase
MTLRNSLVWFRRDLRVEDHAALHHALRSAERRSALVYCVFVFDTDILAGLPSDDRRVQFIHASLGELDARLRTWGAYLIVRHGRAADVIGRLADELEVESVFTNHDHEPAALARDREVQQRLREAGRSLQTFKDQVIFEKDEVLTQAGGAFSVFTPYKNAWLKRLAAHPEALDAFDTAPWAGALAPAPKGQRLPTLEELGFQSHPEPVEPAGMSGAAQLLDAFLQRIAAVGAPALRYAVDPQPGAPADR